MCDMKLSSSLVVPIRARSSDSSATLEPGGFSDHLAQTISGTE